MGDSPGRPAPTYDSSNNNSYTANTKQYATEGEEMEDSKKTGTDSQPKESLLIRHAKRELQLAGIGSEDSDYGGTIAGKVLDLITLFSSQGHSSESGKLALDIFEQLVRFRPLTPLTDSPDEWEDVTEYMESKETVWQSKRASSCFSKDAGKTWLNVETKEKGASISKEEFDKARNELTKKPQSKDADK